MNQEKKSEEFYKKLRSQLYETTTWPSEYLYKFIVTTKSDGVAKVVSLFDNMGAVISKKESKKAKYTSVSINVRMENPEAVIDKYKEVGDKVEGVISL